MSYNNKTQYENCYFFTVEEVKPKNLLKPNAVEMAQVHNYLVVRIDYYSLVEKTNKRGLISSKSTLLSSFPYLILLLLLRRIFEVNYIKNVIIFKLKVKTSIRTVKNGKINCILDQSGEVLILNGISSPCFADLASFDYFRSPQLLRLWQGFPYNKAMNMVKLKPFTKWWLEAECLYFELHSWLRQSLSQISYFLPLALCI